METQRLVLRNFTEADFNDYYEYASMSSVGPRAGWEPLTNRECAWERFRREINKPFQFALLLKSEQKVIGSIEVMDVKRERYKGIEIEDSSKELGSIINEH